MKPVLQKESLCTKRWSFPLIDLSQSQAQMCCYTSAKDISFGKTHSVEEMTNNIYFRERRKEMLLGVKHKDCYGCWNAEKEKRPSPRTPIENLSYFGKDAPSHTVSLDHLDIQNPLFSARNIEVLEIHPGNLCDMKCVYCWSKDSSSWAQEDFEQGTLSKEEFLKMTRKPDPEFLDFFWRWFSSVAGTIKVLSIRGGEATLHGDLPLFIERAVKLAEEAGNTQLQIRFVTNLNCREDRLERLIEVFRSLEKSNFSVLLDVSMESTGKTAEVIRQGLNWNRFEKNIHRIFASNLKAVQVAFLPTISSLCIAGFQDFLEFVRDLQTKYQTQILLHRNSVIHRPWLFPDILTADFKKHLDPCIEILRSTPEMKIQIHWGDRWKSYADFIESIRNSIPEDNESSTNQSLIHRRSQFYSYMNQLAVRRNYMFEDSLPAYRDFYELCRQNYVIQSPSKSSK